MQKHNLIPAQPGPTPNAWCTWETQCERAGEVRDGAKLLFTGDQGAKLGRNHLDETILFGPNSWSSHWEGIRRDLYLLLDDGWDVPRGVHPDRNLRFFGAAEPEPERFPSCRGTAPERLRQLDDMARRTGWRGIGLWIAAQAPGEDYATGLSLEYLREYWSIRLNWMREAGIRYWKVDWGRHAADVAFRRMLTEQGRELAPELLIEHCIGLLPLNDIRIADGEVCGTGRFDRSSEAARKIAEMLEFCDSSRIYDTLSPLTIATCLDRTAFFLSRRPRGLIDLDDELYIAAALGCAFSAMRSPVWDDTYETASRRGKRCKEVFRAAFFHRLAPAFAGGELRCSGRILTDRWLFRDGDTWFAEAIGRNIPQSAPAALSRNLPLPEAAGRDHEIPFLAASRNPNGCCALAALPRLSPERGLHCPRTDVLCELPDLPEYFGVFGAFRSLTVKLPAPPRKLLIQPLDGSTGAEAVKLSGKLPVTIPGELIESCGKTAGEDDFSAGVLFRFQN